MRQAQDFPFISHSPRRWASYVNSRNPMPETIIPLDSRGRRDWKAMGDCEIVRFAKDTINSKGVTSRNGVAEADPGLYDVLRGRKLLDEVGLPDTKVNNRDWAGMGDEELVAHANVFIDEKGIARKMELAKADSGLYGILKKRKLLDEIGLPDSQGWYRDWADMENDELVAHAKAFIAEKGIAGRMELKKADSGLYDVLRKRKLLDKIGLSERYRDWAGMENDELVAVAKAFIAEKGIGGRNELEKADSGLYDVLRKRKLLETIGFKEFRKIRAWGTDGEVIAFALRLIREKQIGNRRGLQNADSGLYLVLNRRKLLDTVFSDVESSQHAEAVCGVVDALESFGEERDSAGPGSDDG